MKVNKICILGGTGFVGKHLVTHLFNGGYQIRVLTRHRDRHKALLVMPKVTLIEADIHDPKALEEQFSDCDAVINLVGILNGSEQDFSAVHEELPRRVMEACRRTGVTRLLHMGALNADADKGPSVYLRTKGKGERAVLQAEGVRVTSFRPSVIFGPDDSFFNRFAQLLKVSPVVPLACPRARFAPVYVGDVVRALAKALENESTFGKVYELCGPRSYTVKQLVEYTARLIGRKRLIMGLSDRLSRWQARVFEYLPGQPFTLDNYLSMQVDSVCRSQGLAALDITPHSVEGIMPASFANKKRDRYSNFRRWARRD